MRKSSLQKVFDILMVMSLMTIAVFFVSREVVYYFKLEQYFERAFPLVVVIVLAISCGIFLFFFRIKNLKKDDRSTGSRKD